MQDPPSDLPLPPPPPSPGTWRPGYLRTGPWTGARVVGVIAAWFGGGVVGGTVALALGFDPADDAVGLAITIVAQSVAALWVVVAVSRRAGSGDLPRDVGLELKRRDAVGIFWGLALQVGVAVLLSPLVRLVTDNFDTQQQVAQLAEQTSDLAGRLVLIVMFVAAAPIVEEVIFRGAMLSWLSRRLSIRWAVAVSAAVFAGVHLADPNAVLAVPSLFVIGLALGWAAQRRGSLSLPIFMHAGVNLLGAIVLMWGNDIVDFLERARDGLESVALLVGLR